MKTLRFSKLTLKNFISIGETPLELAFEDGLNLITGYNRDDMTNKNGIGKSSICDGLFFALFNETIKDLKMSEIVNDKNKKNCEVTLDFSVINSGVTVDYTITRRIKPSECTFIVDGEDKTKSTIPKTNQEIARTIGISKDLFRQSIVMSIGKSTSFFEQTKAEKRKFIEGIFNLEVFSDMLSESRAGYNESKRNKDDLQLKLKGEKVRLVNYQDNESLFETNKVTAIADLMTTIKLDLDKITKLTGTLIDEDTLGDKDSLIADSTLIDERLTKVDALSLKVAVKISKLKDTIAGLTSDINSNSTICKSCNREFDDATARDALKAERTVTRDELKEELIKHNSNKKVISTKKITINGERDIIRSQIATIDSQIRSNTTTNSYISSIKDTCKDNKTKIDKKKLEVSNFATLISDTEALITEVTGEYNTTFKEYKIFEICKFVLSEEGVKSVIIDKLKNLLNTKLNEYLDLLDSSITCTFDEYFTETIYNKYGVEKSYDAFSGGESKRIDLAILLTFQDILRDQSGIDIRLGFYDEILDSSIDEVGRKRVLSILKDKSETTPIYIISHRGKMSDLIDKEIILEKHNDFTFLKGE